MFCKNCFRLFSFIYHRAFVCNVLIALKDDKIPIDFGFTLSKVNGIMVTFVKNNVNMLFAHDLENRLSQSIYISDAYRSK